MFWKLVMLAGVVTIGMAVLGYGPAELKRAANDLSSTNASAISPSGGDAGGWG
ncbi:hypothetical protein A6F68_01318 [Tsuneonella dongtanensis]|uniref:Uncharacterized protein n=1 Tax=Tsuneonella dongtanensis TaxID=692370 RepID=A0A1B2ACQ5_9SPHN|nr:hypothetical protein [Tsuneonella dongtanensis]ANY19835.1 hypothetical protein A6F68_01318 [Tsuneonella dongtanensis]